MRTQRQALSPVKPTFRGLRMTGPHGSPQEMLLSREGLCVLVPGPDPSTCCALRPILSFLPVTAA